MKSKTSACYMDNATEMDVSKGANWKLLVIITTTY